MNATREVSQENNPAKIGLIISAMVIAGSLIPKISSPLFSISNEHSLVIFFMGMFLFMLFMGIKVNMSVRFYGIYIIDSLPNNYTMLSKSFFSLAALFLITALILLISGF